MFDDTVKRLNVDERGELLGEFTAEDKLLILTQTGIVKTVKPELNYHFGGDIIILEKWNPMKPISVIYFDGEKKRYYVKRFMINYTEKEIKFITNNPKSKIEIVTTDYKPNAEIIFSKRSLNKKNVNFESFNIKGIKAVGYKITEEKIKKVNLLAPTPYNPEILNEIEVDEENIEKEEKSQKTLF